MTAGADAPRRLSPDNQRVKLARRLARSRRARIDRDQFIIEGPGLIADAVAAGLAVDAVLVPEDIEPTWSTIAALPLFTVPDRTFASISTTTNPQPALAIAARPQRVVPLGQGLVLALVGVADPGNVGTLIRAVEAAGGVGVILVGSSADPFGPKTVRASAGSVFRLPTTALDVNRFRAIVDDAEVTVWGARAHGGSPPDQVDLSGAPLVVLGNESRGLDADVGIDQWLSIPMAPGPESLNVAMAGTIIVFEAARQRPNGRNGDPTIT